MKAIILGATGAVGKALVAELTTDSNYEQVRAITRREYQFGIESSKFSQKVIDFEALESHKADLQGFDTVFIAMGTTRAAAGSAEAFRRIDQDLTVTTAAATLTKGLRQHLLYVSSSSASESSPFLYVKSKGQTERRLRELGADKTTILRPGLIELKEPRETSRFAESLFAPVISKFRYVGIRSMSSSVGEIARAMRIVAEDESRGAGTVITNAQILSLCDA